MSSTTEPGQDLLAVACVVEASIALAAEWSRILAEYIFPLLKRLHELHPTHQFRLAFVAYGAADTRPSPLVSKIFFSPLSHVTKELRDDPAKFGIGQTSCGGTRGLSALEGLVAAIELFDVLMASTNHQKEYRPPVSHLIHIAACPPDHTQRPQCNTLQHLDSVTWETLPTELRKRKIHLSLISLRKVQQFQELQLAVVGNGVQSPWFNVQPPHVITLSGFPAPSKTVMKRPTEPPQSDRNSEAKRQRITSGDPSQKSLSGSPALAAASKPMRPPSVQPPHSQAPSVSLQSQSTSTQIPPFTQPSQANQPQHTVPQSTAAAVTPQPNLLHQSAFVERFKQLLGQLDLDIKNMDMRIGAAQQQGQMTVAAELQRERAEKVQRRTTITQNLRNQVQAMQASFSRQAAIPLATNADAPRPTQPATQGDSGTASSSLTTLGMLGPQGNRSASGGVEEQKLQTSSAQAMVQLWQSQGGSVNGTNIHSVGPNQSQMSSEVAEQMKRLVEKTGFRPSPFLVPQSASMTTSQEANANPGTTSNQKTVSHVWEGAFSWVAPQGNGQGPQEMQVHVSGVANPHISTRLYAHTWPKNMALTFCKEPLKEPAEIMNWLKSHQPLLMTVRFVRSSGANDPASNNSQSFQSLINLMSQHHIYAYAAWKLPNGHFANNIVIFPMGTFLGGAVFPVTGLPDLPGSGNTLEAVQPASGPHVVRDLSCFPPVAATHLQALDPVKREQFIKQYMMRVQLPLQQQQSQPQSMQVLSTQDATLGTLNANAMAPPVGNMSMALPPNVSGVSRPGGGGMYGNGGGTVNMEMLQSFMQRNAAASSQSTNPG
ncbi:hypothetical protein EDC04DRAFT_2658214 [Pisolithus marmoratus]|nr:hypothetical protein EDC04DRAFT_2658214 [Pisolithus marmoratus]